MNIPKLGENTMILTDRAIMRAVLPTNGPKRLAQLLGAPIETARTWYYRTLSSSRRREIALALLKELDAENARRAAVREQLVKMVGNDDQMASSSIGAVVLKDRSSLPKSSGASAANRLRAHSLLVGGLAPCPTMLTHQQKMRR